MLIKKLMNKKIKNNIRNEKREIILIKHQCKIK